ncbi:MAG: S-layer family protein [Spirulina sp. SIO3F2]|nr:S-layer family protein [Spirulina sp. SIO3F2]
MMTKYDAVRLLRSQRLAKCLLGGCAIASLLVWGGMVLGGNSAIAQTVTDDGTVGTTVTTSGGFFWITGGTAAGTNLFHSFTDFSPETVTTVFDAGSGSSIERVISRVTGNNISSINGTLAVINGNSPDLFLINPNGIVLGPNAFLFLDGSFIASTASGILFPNNLEFSANDTTVSPLLTINQPIGLNLGSNPGAIAASDGFLRVNAEQTLGLIGGEILIDNTFIQAEMGRVELLAGANGTVDLDTSNNSVVVETQPNLGIWHNITLNGFNTFIDVSGDGAGTIQIQGAQVDLTESPFLQADTFGTISGGEIRIQGTEAIRLVGNDPSVSGSVAAIDTEVQGGANATGADIILEAPTLLVADGAVLGAELEGTGQGGNITLNATGDIIFQGTNSAGFGPLVSAEVDDTGVGQGGSLFLNAQRVFVLEGTIFDVDTQGNGNGGNINITADYLEVGGVDGFGLNSVITTQVDDRNLFAVQGGNINLTTQELIIKDGALIESTTFADGNAGNININTQRLTIDGANPDAAGTRSGITSGSEMGTGSGADPNPTGIGGAINLTVTDLRVVNNGRIFAGTETEGNAGSLNITGQDVTIENGGTVSVSSTGTGNAGNLSINATNLYLNQGGQLQAESAAGSQGNINLTASQILLLRRGSRISTNATGSATGGNITINAPVIAGYENSDIVANAVLGAGGNINITTQGIFGLAFRDQLTPENDITASSQFGVSGTITVSEFSLDPSSGLVELMTALSDASDQVDATCAAAGNSEFIATGRGGIPPVSDAPRGGTIGPWQDIRKLNRFFDATVTTPSTVSASIPTIQEATGFQQLSNGQIALVSEPEIAHNRNHYLTCAMGGTDAAIKRG